MWSLLGVIGSILPTGLAEPSCGSNDPEENMKKKIEKLLTLVYNSNVALIFNQLNQDLLKSVEC